MGFLCGAGKALGISRTVGNEPEIEEMDFQLWKEVQTSALGSYSS